MTGMSSAEIQSKLEQNDILNHTLREIKQQIYF